MIDESIDQIVTFRCRSADQAVFQQLLGDAFVAIAVVAATFYLSVGMHTGYRITSTKSGDLELEERHFLRVKPVLAMSPKKVLGHRFYVLEFVAMWFWKFCSIISPGLGSEPRVSRWCYHVSQWSDMMLQN